MFSFTRVVVAASILFLLSRAEPLFSQQDRCEVILDLETFDAGIPPTWREIVPPDRERGEGWGAEHCSHIRELDEAAPNADTRCGNRIAGRPDGVGGRSFADRTTRLEL